MKRLLSAALALLALTACAKQQRFSAVEIEHFDTVTTLIMYCDSQKEFDTLSEQVFNELESYHKLFDAYNSYDGINNIKTINDNAGIAPVKVDEPLFELLKFSKEAYTLTNGKTNIAMGSVLYLWHEYRQEGLEAPQSARIPDVTELEAAAQHTDIENVVLDEENKTVFLKDPETRLDVGATAKGFVAQRLCELLRELGATRAALSLGGNVCTVGEKAEKTPWAIGIQDPADPDGTVMNTRLADVCLVTSGDYQRYYTVDGKRYHHIIDPETLVPAEYFSSVSVICADSALADTLSTALFCMPYEDGKKLTESLGGVEALWITADGKQLTTDGFDRYTEVAQ